MGYIGAIQTVGVYIGLTILLSESRLYLQGSFDCFLDLVAMAFILCLDPIDGCS